MRQVASTQPAVSNEEEYTALGIPVEWVEVLQKLGYTTIEKLKEVEKPGKLHQEIGTVSVDDVMAWLSA